MASSLCLGGGLYGSKYTKCRTEVAYLQLRDTPRTKKHYAMEKLLLVSSKGVPRVGGEQKSSVEWLLEWFAF